MDIIEKINSELNTSILTLNLINSLLEDKSEDERKAILKRACQRGDLVRIRKGLYLVGEKKRKNPFSSFELANFIVEPSHISIESALSHYGLIPEAVYTTTLVTTKRGLEFKTPVGYFSFSHLKTEYFNFGFFRYKYGANDILIATPLRRYRLYRFNEKTL